MSLPSKAESSIPVKRSLSPTPESQDSAGQPRKIARTASIDAAYILQQWTPELLLASLQTPPSSTQTRGILRAISVIFSNAQTICTFFQKQHDYLKDDCSVDVVLAAKVFAAVLEHSVFKEPLRAAVATLAESVQHGVAHKAWIAVYPLLCQYPLLANLCHVQVLSLLCSGLLGLSSDSRCILQMQLTDPHRVVAPKNDLEAFPSLHKQREQLKKQRGDTLLVYVHLFQSLLTYVLEKQYYLKPSTQLRHDTLVVRLVSVLALLHDINREQELAAYTEFYNPAFSKVMDFKAEIDRYSNKEFTFLNYCFLFDLQAKVDIIREESNMLMYRGYLNAFFLSFFLGLRKPILQLEINRQSIVADTLGQIAHIHTEDLRKQLRVKFIGEEGEDEGGITKEFFHLVFRQLFHPNYGMFKHNEESGLLWLQCSNCHDLDTMHEFQMAGILTAMAIYNLVILDSHFPQALYKKLQGYSVQLEDLVQLDPMLGKSLQTLLNFEGDVASSFSYSFQVQYELDGQVVTHDLVPNGENIPLTNENRSEFVKLYVDFLLNKCIDKQFKVFEDGFSRVVADSILKQYHPLEVEYLLCGSPHFDLHELEAVTVYEGGYTQHSQVVRHFWEIMHEFTLEQQKQLLFFATGSDRAPIGGLSKLKFMINKNGTDSDRLPTAHTCFNILLLPEYKTKEKLHNRLLTAIQNAEGFGMI